MHSPESFEAQLTNQTVPSHSDVQPAAAAAVVEHMMCWRFVRSNTHGYHGRFSRKVCRVRRVTEISGGRTVACARERK